jgi:hypothetical protein
MLSVFLQEWWILGTMMPASFALFAAASGLVVRAVHFLILK